MKKRVLALLICACMLIGMVPVFANEIAESGSTSSSSVEGTTSSETETGSTEGTGDASEPPVDNGDASEPPVDTGDTSEPPVDNGDTSEPPVDNGDASNTDSGETDKPVVTPPIQIDPPATEEPGAGDVHPPVEEKPSVPPVIEPELPDEFTLILWYTKLMQCESLDEFDDVLDEMGDELCDQFFTWLEAEGNEERAEKLRAHKEDIEPEPLPPVILESEPPVQSEIILPEESDIVDFTNVAPFLDPVVGQQPSRLNRLPAAPGAPKAASAGLPLGDDPTEPVDNGIELNKTAIANDDGTYTISLEAYATGSKIITEVTEDVPTDIVLVLDQSRSMNEPIGTVSFKPYQDSYNTNRTHNAYHYNNRHNGGNANLWHKVGDKYYSVSVTVQAGDPSYTKITSGSNNNSNKGRTNYWDNRNNLYALVGKEYQQVTLTRQKEYVLSGYVYTYELPGGKIIATSEGDRKSPTFSGTDDNTLYLLSADESQNVYTYTYTDADGVTQTIGTSIGANAGFETTLYERVVNTNGGGSRIDALTTALNSFTDAVNEKAAGADRMLGTDDDVNHRVAVVGFASGDRWNGNRYNYGNTEVFVGANQYKYGRSAEGVYGTAFQNMNTLAGQGNVTASIEALDAEGGTLTNLGLEMANGILSANPVPAGEKRNRVVIVFTDGQPGWSGYDSDVADNAIAQATAIKKNGASVYSVGIFSGADASSAGNKNSNNTEKSNWFMQNVSSNDGVVQTPSYYLSASDADSLNNIFEQIADNIEYGGSISKLDENAVIKDIISPQFTLPDGTTAKDITLKTYSYNGPSTSDPDAWTENNDAMGATATVNGDKVDVTGFDFSKNYVGTVTENGTSTYRGDKLVISFVVHAKDAFLGGNNVYTNTNAGIYENNTAERPVEDFNRPQVNVPIEGVEVTAEDKNVYFSGSVTAAELEAGKKVKFGDTVLDLSAENYGLESWQVEHVDITVKVLDADGNEITTGLTNLMEDTTYKIVVTVSPKEDETGAGASGTPAEATINNSSQKAINVFEPEMTFHDSTIYLGQLPDYASENAPDLVHNPELLKWKHNETDSGSVTMIGSAPRVGVVYEPVQPSDAKDYFKNCTKVQPKLKVADTECGTVIGTMTENGVQKFIVHVLKPTVTWKDSTCYYGDSIPTNFTNNVEKLEWKCADGKTVQDTTREAPTLTYTYSSTYSDLMPNKTVPVRVETVMSCGENIRDGITFKWNGNCGDKNCTQSEPNPDYQFYVYPKTCTLVVEKNITGKIDDPQDSFIFTVKGDNSNKYSSAVEMKVVVQGNGSTTITGLPVGTYTVTENQDWSWRYRTEDEKKDTATLRSDIAQTVTINNAITNDKWLSGSSYAVNTWNSKGDITVEGATFFQKILKMLRG